MKQLERLRRRGIRRLGSRASGHRYRRARGGRLDRATLARIRALRIPPAWTEVLIDPDPDAPLQAVGRDRRQRVQYLYHPRCVRRREGQKFRRLLQFGAALPRMRRKVARDLARSGLDRERVLSAILRILETCFLRSGSEAYVAENGSFGLATLRRRHVSVRGDAVVFDFPGKGGTRQRREIEDRRIARLVRRLSRMPGNEVFKYPDAEGKIRDVRRAEINAYIRELMEGPFSAKDFRTWAGTLICASALTRIGCANEAKERRKRLREAIKETAEHLGNTPAVCRTAYISPVVLDGFEKGIVLTCHVDTTAALLAGRRRGLHRSERALLRLLDRNSGRREPRG